jgi:DNA invertase Pin-like site-specific DNA recombinase
LWDRHVIVRYMDPSTRQTFLYSRVSTNKQSVDAQEHDLLTRFPTGLLVRETASGIKHRPELDKLLAAVKHGDTIAVVALDRLGRSLREILGKIEDLNKRGVNLVSLREHMDYGTPTGKMVTQVMLAVAELERNLISQRTKATLQAKKAAGVRLGRAPTYSQEVIREAFRLREMGRTYREISHAVGVSRAHLCRILKDAPRSVA